MGLSSNNSLRQCSRGGSPSRLLGAVATRWSIPYDATVPLLAACAMADARRSQAATAELHVLPRRRKLVQQRFRRQGARRVHLLRGEHRKKLWPQIVPLLSHQRNVCLRSRQAADPRREVCAVRFSLADRWRWTICTAARRRRRSRCVISLPADGMTSPREARGPRRQLGA